MMATARLESRSEVYFTDDEAGRNPSADSVGHSQLVQRGTAAKV